MRKVLVIAGREYRAAVRTKSFLISLVFVPLLLGGSMAVQVLLGALINSSERRFAIVDRTPGHELFTALQAANDRRVQFPEEDRKVRQPQRAAFAVKRIEASADSAKAIAEQRYELSERVRHGDFAGFLEIGPDVLHPTEADAASDRTAIRFHASGPGEDGFARWALHVINQAIVQQRAREAGLSPEQGEELAQFVPLRFKGLSRRDPATGAITETSETSQLALYLLPAGFAGLMFMVIMLGATPLMQGVIEEKMQRIAEVLLGSVRPFQLMMGKLLGMVGVSLTLASVYLAIAGWVAVRQGYAQHIPLPVIAWFAVYLVLAVLMYGSVFIAIGAACTDMKETQTLLLPVALLICLPLFSLSYVLQEPNSPFAVAISLFPFATPMIMTVRQAVPPGVAFWQPLLGVFLVLGTTLLCVYCAGRIFRVGILLQGKGASLGELTRWLLRG